MYSIINHTNIFSNQKLKSSSITSYPLLSPIKLISKNSEFFPKKLFDLEDCPDILYILGNEKILNNFSLSIIGTRKSSNLGNDITFNLAKDLSNNNITIVSGLASGIDTQAHLGAISSTIAIVAYGFNYFTHTNLPLIENILKNNGAIVSEYFPDTPPKKFTYLKRNRLVAAISNGVVVTEAPAKSGALYTANLALTLSKPVFAIPWNINVSRGLGCNYLLERKAHILLKHEDILNYFKKNNFSFEVSCNVKTQSSPNNILKVPKPFINLYNYIKQNEPIPKESIYSYFQDIEISTLNSNLVLMELQDLITLTR